MNLAQSYQDLARACNGRILVMDGGFTALLHKRNLREEDYRGKMFADHSVDLLGNDEILCITAPERVKEVHRAYLEAGADIVRTNTGNAISLEQEKYRLENMAYDIALAGAKVACEAVAEYNDDVRNCKTGKLGQVVERKFVAGRMGPTSVFASGYAADGSASDSNGIGFREMVEAYGEQARGLLDGGVDILLLEGVCDAVNVKAALFAVAKVCNDRGELVPVMVSGLLSRAGGRMMAGQDVQALLHSVSSYPVFSVGFEAAGEVPDVFPFMKVAGNVAVRMSAMVDIPLEGMKPHDSDAVKERAGIVWQFTDAGLLNIAGGSASSLPDTVRFLVKVLKGCRPRRVPARRYNMLLSGLDPMNVAREGNCVMIGQNDGSKILAVNLDAGASLAGARLARCPIMVESEKWDQLVAGMEGVQGKGLARSISLAEGEEIFLVKAAEIRKRGFAVVCFAADENGVATTFERGVAIVERMYRLLIGKLNFQAEDIVFEPNTALNDIDPVNLLFKACRFVKATLPYAHVLGDVSRLGLDFDGNDEIRKGLMSVFLHHAKKAGLDFVVGDAEALPAYEEIPYRPCCLLEDVVLSRAPDAREKLRRL